MIKIGDIALDINGVKIGKYAECARCKELFPAKQTQNRTCSKECSSANRSAKTSAARMGKAPWNKGKCNIYSTETKYKMGSRNRNNHTSEAIKLKQSESLKEYYQNNPHHNIGGSILEDHKDKISKSLNKIKHIRTKNTVEDVQSIISQDLGLPLNAPITQQDKVELTCSCGKTYLGKVQSIMKGQNKKCRACNFTKSGPELELGQLCKDLNFHIEENIRPPFLNSKELDIFIPSKNVAIEYHGLAFHSTRPIFGDIRDMKAVHLDKYNKCKANGIKLIQVFEDEWLNKSDIVKSMIKSKLGKSSNTIYARKCEIKIITNSESKSFFDITHISGYVQSSLNLGLYFNNELVSCISFRSTWNKKYGYNVVEIARFSSKLDTQVIGGFSKLLKAAIPQLKALDYQKILTYADCRFGSGDVYNKSGFTHLGHTGANYFYEKNGIREDRFSHRKDSSKQGTELEQNALNGWHQIYDAGSEIYLLEI